MASRSALPAIASPGFFSSMIDRVDRVLERNNQLPVRYVPDPIRDPALSADSGEFLRVELLDHIEVCSEEDCDSDTRIAIVTHEDATGAPYCNAHAHVLFADWMVGA